MRRRDFIGAIGAAAAWPLAVRAQGERVRRISVLDTLATDDPESRPRTTAFEQALHELGWTVGRNIRIDYRWPAGNTDDIRKYAAELVSLAPDVVVASTSIAVSALQRLTHSVPIVFVNVIDPVGAGLVASLARPAGNATGFTLFEYGVSGKWLELLKEIAPRLTRAAVLRDPDVPTGIGHLAAIQAVAPALRVDLSAVGVRDPDEIDRAVRVFAGESNGGLIVTPSPMATRHRNLIITLAARHRLPVVYPFRFYVTSGGLVCYGPDVVDPYRRAASYVDRILKGEKPADLPVQAPTKYELVINLKTAKALDLTIPTGVLTRADEVIE